MEEEEEGWGLGARWLLWSLEDVHGVCSRMEGGMVQDRFSAQAGHSWLCRMVPDTHCAAEGSWSPGLSYSRGAWLARRKKPSPMVLSHHIIHPCMLYFIISLGFSPLIYVFPFGSHFILVLFSPIPDTFPFLLFFPFHSSPPLPLSLDFPFRRLHITSLDVMTNPG